MRTSLIGFGTVLLIGIAIAYHMLSEEQDLPVINPVQLNDSLVEDSLQSKMAGHRIGSFELINQFGESISEDDFQDKIYVADFFFTTCPGICKSMAKQMIRVQEENEGEDDFRILSHSVQPEIDQPEVLLEYAELHNANPMIWQFATGKRDEINKLARSAYFAAKQEPGYEDDMVHTENFVLVDKEKRIRGIYDGTSAKEVDRLINDIEILRKSYE